MKPRRKTAMKMKEILIVDDEKNIRLTIKKALENSDVSVSVAFDGQEALALMKKQTPDVVLLDIRMPGMDGMEVLRRIREQNKDSRVIMISAHGTVENAVEALKLGACDFLRKPFTPAEVREAVDRALKRKEGFFAKLLSGRPEKIPEPQLPPASVLKKPAEPGSVSADDLLELARDSIERLDFDAAKDSAKMAIAADSSRPEAYNILGVLAELSGDMDLSRRYFRAALALDPAYDSARINLDRSARRDPGKTLKID
jgi:DNA-binding response OmpR family regulator